MEKLNSGNPNNPDTYVPDSVCNSWKFSHDPDIDDPAWVYNHDINWFQNQ